MSHIQSESSQGPPGRPAYRGAAVHHVDIWEPAVSVNEVRDLHAYLVKTCLHGTAGYQEKIINQWTKIPFSLAPPGKIVQLSTVTLVFEPLNQVRADKLFQHFTERKNISTTTAQYIVQVRQFTLGETQTTSDQLHCHQNGPCKVEVTFDGFGPQIPRVDPWIQIPLRDGKSELHRKLKRDAVPLEVDWEPIGKTQSYDTVKWHMQKEWSGSL